jgi:hypothetical protein
LTFGVVTTTLPISEHVVSFITITGGGRKGAGGSPRGEAIRQLREYFAGRRSEFELPLAPENSGQNAQFFLSEIRKRVSAEGVEPLHVVIVLSGPMAFGKANLRPMETSADPSRKVFYIRYHALARRTPPGFGGPENNTRRRGGRGARFDFPRPAPLAADELFGLIKALDPRLFDVTTAEEFRKALATILSEIGRWSNTHDTWGGPIANRSAGC